MTAIPKDVTLPTAPVKLDYRSNSSNIAFYRVLGRDDVYLEVLRNDDFRSRGLGMSRKPTSFGFTLMVHNGKKRWRDLRFDYTPKTPPKPGNLPVATVTRQLNAWLKEHA